MGGWVGWVGSSFLDRSPFDGRSAPNQAGRGPGSDRVSQAGALRSRPARARSRASPRRIRRGARGEILEALRSSSRPPMNQARNESRQAPRARRGRGAPEAGEGEDKGARFSLAGPRFTRPPSQRRGITSPRRPPDDASEGRARQAGRGAYSPPRSPREPWQGGVGGIPRGEPGQCEALIIMWWRSSSAHTGVPPPPIFFFHPPVFLNFSQFPHCSQGASVMLLFRQRLLIAWGLVAFPPTAFTVIGPRIFWSERR